MAVLINKATGQVFEVDDAEANDARASMDLVPATPEQIEWISKQREYEAKPFTEKLKEKGQTYAEGLAEAGRELGKLRLDDSGLAESLFPEQAPAVQAAQEGFQARRDAMLADPGVAERAERHPISHALGVDTPALFVSGGVIGKGASALARAGGMALESAAVGGIEEAVQSTEEGREYELGNAAELAAQDLAFSGLAAAAAKVVSRVGGLLMFGTGNTMARNVGRGLDETAAPVVPDDVRFDGPLLEAETRSRRTAAAASPDMPPGPERDEMLRRAAPDLNERVKTEAGEMFDDTVESAKASVAYAEGVQSRIDDLLPRTTPAQTSWSADATGKLDGISKALDATTDPVAAPFVERVRAVTDETIAAIDGAADSASWFKASTTARDKLDDLADELSSADLPPTHRLRLIVDDARGFLGRSLSDRALFGDAAEMHATLHGAAREKIGRAVGDAGGSLRERLTEFVSADAAARAQMRGPLERAIEGFEELAAAHERFETANSRVIETLRERATKLRRGMELADAVESAQRSAPKAQTPRASEPRSTTPDVQRAQTLADHIRKRAEKAGVKVAQGVVDYAAGPGRAVYDDAVSDALKGAIQTVGAIGGLAAMGPPGFVAGWLTARKLGKKMAPKVGQQILDAAQRYVKQYGSDTAGAALLAGAALDEGEEGEDGNTLAASVGGLFFAKRFAERALGAVESGAKAAGKGVYRASEAVAGAVDTVTGKATEALGRGTYKAGRKVGEVAGAGIDTAVKPFADEARSRRIVASATRAAMSAAVGPLGWVGREFRHEAAKAVADYFGPRISKRAIEWLERRSGKTTAETVQEAVQETAEAARKDPLLLPRHTEQAEAIVEDLGEKIRRALNETPQERAKALAAFPKRLGGDPEAQRQLLQSAVDDLVKTLGEVSSTNIASKSGRSDVAFKGSPKQAASIDARIAAYGKDPKFIDLLQERAAITRRTPFGPGKERELWELQKDILQENEDLFPRVPYEVGAESTGKETVGQAALAFAAQAKKALQNARTAQERFRIGMQMTEALADHAARAGDGEMAKVFGSYAEKMWEAMGQREIWMGQRELEREAKRQGKKRELLLSKLSAGEKLGIAAVAGSAAVEDEEDGAAMATAGLMLGSRKGLRLGERVKPHEASDQIVKNRVVAARRRVKESGPMSGARVERELLDEFEHDPSLQEEARKAFAIVRQNSEITSQLDKPKAVKGADFDALKKLEAVASQRAKESLSPEAIEAISKYTGGSFGLMRALREGADVDSPYLRQEMEKLRPLLPHLDEAAKALKISNPTEHGALFRGIRLEDNELNELLTRDDFRTASLLSTSFDGGTAERFALKDRESNSVVLRFLKADEAALAMGPELSRNPHEFEALLPKDAAFKVVNRSYGSGVHVIDLEQIEPASLDALREMGALAVLIGVAASDDEDSSAALASAGGLGLLARGKIRRLSGYKALGDLAKEFGGEEPEHLYKMLKEAKVPTRKESFHTLYDASRIGIAPNGRPVVFDAKGYAQSDARHVYQSELKATEKLKAKKAPLDFAKMDADRAKRIELVKSVKRKGGFGTRDHRGYDTIEVNEKALKSLATKTGKAIQALEPEEQLALLDYIEGGGASTFRGLQQGAESVANKERFAEALPAFESAVEKLQRPGLTESIGALWRGFHLSPEDATRLVNSEYVETGALTSTSFSPFHASDKFAETAAAEEMGHVPVVLKFEHVERAAPISAAGFSKQYGTIEREALLPKGAAYKVKNVTRHMSPMGGSIEVTLSEVPKSDAMKIGFVLAGLLGLGAALSPDEASAAEPEPESPPPDDRTIAAQRILSIDEAATQRIRHTARVLAGLAKPPDPEGLRTSLGRFGEEHDDPRAAFEERKAILQKADIAPALVYDVIGATLGDVASVSPELYQAAAARVLDNLRYLRENLPPEVRTSIRYPKGAPPSESAMRDWATQWNTVMDQESVLEDIERGTVTHLQIQTLKGAHRDTYERLRTDMIEEVGANFASIPTSTKMQLDILFEADGLAGPMFSSAAAAVIGDASAAAAKRKQPGPGGAGETAEELAPAPSGMAAIKSSVTNRGV